MQELVSLFDRDIIREVAWLRPMESKVLTFCIVQHVLRRHTFAAFLNHGIASIQPRVVNTLPFVSDSDQIRLIIKRPSLNLPIAMLFFVVKGIRSG